MTAQVLFNPLTYIDRLTRGGFTPDQARASAEALETAFSESVATKADIAEVKHDIADVKPDIAQTKAELKLDIAQSKHEILRWLFAFNIIMIGAIFSIVKFIR